MNNINELKELLKNIKKGKRGPYWKKSVESLEKRIKELEDNPKEILEKSSGPIKNTFWKSTDENHMRNTLGTAWDHRPNMKINNWTKGHDGSWLSKRAIKELNQKKQQDFKKKRESDLDEARKKIRELRNKKNGSFTDI